MPEPYLGPLISAAAADRALSGVRAIAAGGASVIRPLARIADRSAAFLSPGIVDVTGIEVADEEIFAPLLQVTRVPDFNAAIDAANATRYGLAAGLVSDDDALWACYRRPSAFYAADYCAYPVASFEAASVRDLSADIRGLA